MVDGIDKNPEGTEDFTARIDFITSYYRERYEEVKVIYRRLEDKVNFLLAVIGVEASAVLAIFGSIDLGKAYVNQLFFKLAILCLCSCILSLFVCFYYLWHSWGLRSVPYMPIHGKPEDHDFLLEDSLELILRSHMILYCDAVSQIEELHKEKSIYVANLFNYVALSFGFFILAVMFLMINKV